MARFRRQGRVLEFAHAEPIGAMRPCMFMAYAGAPPRPRHVLRCGLPERTGTPTAAMTHDDIVLQVTEKTRAVFPALRRLLLFGSRARGDAKPDSDYDLLVVTPLPDGARNRSVALRMALLDLDATFDIVVMTPTEFEALCSSPGYWQRAVVREAVVQHEAA